MGLIYGNQEKANEKWQFTVQLYTHAGKFLGEQKVSGFAPEPGSYIFYFRAATNTLYYLYHTVDKDLEDVYQVYQYIR